MVFYGYKADGSILQLQGESDKVDTDGVPGITYK
jgi:hypothetical protein